MTPREIIAEAWAITTREGSLRRWSFLSAILETMLSVKLIGYQLYFFYEQVYRKGEAGFFDIEVYLYKALPPELFFSIAGAFILLVIVEFFVPHICLGAIIGLGGKAHKKDKVKGGLVLGLYNFFPIFALHGILLLSSISTVVTVSSLIFRYVEGPLRTFSLIVVLVLFLLCILLEFFFSFAEEAVVLEKYGPFEAIGKSFKLIISNIGHIVFLLLLLLVISLRIVLNVIITVLIPGIIIGLGLLLTTVLPTVLSYSIAGVAGLAMVVAASYFFAYLLAFKQTVWTITYLELRKHKELDVVVDGEI